MSCITIKQFYALCLRRVRDADNVIYPATGKPYLTLNLSRVGGDGARDSVRSLKFSVFVELQYFGGYGDASGYNTYIGGMQLVDASGNLKLIDMAQAFEMLVRSGLPFGGVTLRVGGLDVLAQHVTKKRLKAVESAWRHERDQLPQSLAQAQAYLDRVGYDSARGAKASMRLNRLNQLMMVNQRMGAWTGMV
jgi:hypothetical protein